MTADAPRVIRFAELQPSWSVKQATEPGFMRWLVSWLGGPPGYVNFNPGLAALSERAAMGFMCMPQGNRQAGLHTHTVAEIYVILKGRIEGYDHTGVPHHAGPLDCIYIPAGVPHGVRTVGLEDLHLVWVHDALERVGASVYVDRASPGDSPDHIRILRFAERPPRWPELGRGPPETMCWRIGYVGPGPGEVANPGISLGLTTVPSGHQDRASPVAYGRTMLCVGESATVACEDWTATLEALDAVHVPPGRALTLLNHGVLPARVLWLEERS